MNSATCNCENEKYLASIMDESAILCDEVIESYEEATHFNETKAVCKKENFYVLLSFLLMTIPLLIAVSIYYYLIKYQAKQKNNKIKQIIYW